MAVASGTAFSVRPPAPAPSASARPCACAAAGGMRARSADGGSGKWWAPLLGWSGQPDYIDAQPAAASEEPQHRGAAAPRRFGVLTEDKARQLRMQMMETESFHDAMYHSAIASRLASAAPDGTDH
ncbi:hypothetical protein PR202_gb26263 [Eleusine coracana subsp. coracana]|uniref:Uncharacterized protein n=1 Tax=Eleusine coracana subsp. coracana TaxID=191504 RepID=A0AAV5FRD9_ELECO|nr:hypothetical protein PR202_gb26263 [Eleusine coracana subsp. coracana]